MALHDWFGVSAAAGARGPCGGRQGLASGAHSPGGENGKHTDDNAQKVKVLTISDQGDTSKSVVFCVLVL